MLIGVSCNVETRFEAVTTISSRAPVPSGVTAESALTLNGENSPRTHTAADPAATAVICLEFLCEIKIESIPEGRIACSPDVFYANPRGENAKLAAC